MLPFRFVLLLLFAGLPLRLEAEPQTLTFIQLSDTHRGFSNPRINPDAKGTLPKAIAEVNGLKIDPDFLIFTGDETHITGDTEVRRQRITEFKSMTSALAVKTIHYLPGEHDVGQDQGDAYREFFGDLHYTFDVKGVHFVALDNLSNPDASLGPDQLAWLAGILKNWDKNSTIVLFAHRPLIDVWAAWDWRTKDGAQAMALLKPFTHVTLFYGHIHQQRVDTQAGFTQYAARGMMFPLPAPGSMATPNQVPWDPSHPYQGLGFRVVTIDLATQKVLDHEYSLPTEPGAAPEEEDLD